MIAWVPSKATPHIDIFAVPNAVAVLAFPSKLPFITLPAPVGTSIPLVNVFTPLTDCATFPVNFNEFESNVPIWVVCVFNVDVCPLIDVKFVCISVSFCVIFPLSVAVMIAPEPLSVISAISAAFIVTFCVPLKFFPAIVTVAANSVALLQSPVNSLPTGIIIPLLAVNLPAIAWAPVVKTAPLFNNDVLVMASETVVAISVSFCLSVPDIVAIPLYVIPKSVGVNVISPCP